MPIVSADGGTGGSDISQVSVHQLALFRLDSYINSRSGQLDQGCPGRVLSRKLSGPFQTSRTF